MTSTTTALPPARRAMIDSQLRTSGVNEAWVLSAMAACRREDYVPADQAGHAYIDRALPLGNGRFLASPLVHGRMLAQAAPQRGDKVLIIGNGNGYLPALVTPLAGSVTVIDAKDAVPGGDYSLIIIDGAIEVLPDAVSGALAEGGRIVTGCIERGVARLAAGRKSAGTVALTTLCDLPVPALAEFAAPKHWSF